jgi:signal transduction histidine kinase
MLHEFITSYRDLIITRTREKLTDRPWPVLSERELEHGVPLFLSQLVETLRLEIKERPSSDSAIGASAAKHGRELRALGFNISQVVHDYGDICQAVTEIAVEQNVPITTEEFHTLNRCLDTAIAGAVTEHARITAETRRTEEIERTGQLAHDIRDVLNTAVLAFNTLKTGAVAVNGSTGAVLARSLMSLRDLVDNTLSDVRMSANIHRRDPIQVTDFVGEIAIVANLQADCRGQRFNVESSDAGLVVEGDAQLLASAVMNLLNNAFKFTPVGGLVVLRAYREGQRLRLAVADECGGMAGELPDVLFQPFAQRRKHDRSGLGLGLSIARKAVRIHHGDISFQNTPGHGCVFVIDLPLAANDLQPAPVTIPS